MKRRPSAELGIKFTPHIAIGPLVREVASDGDVEHLAKKISGKVHLLSKVEIAQAVAEKYDGRRFLATQNGLDIVEEYNQALVEARALSAVIIDKAVKAALTSRPSLPPYGLGMPSFEAMKKSLQVGSLVHRVKDLIPMKNFSYDPAPFSKLYNGMQSVLIAHINDVIADPKDHKLERIIERLRDRIHVLDSFPTGKRPFETPNQFITSGSGSGLIFMVNFLASLPQVLKEYKIEKADKIIEIAERSFPGIGIFIAASFNTNEFKTLHDNLEIDFTYDPTKFSVTTERDDDLIVKINDDDIEVTKLYAPPWNFTKTRCPASVRLGDPQENPCSHSQGIPDLSAIEMLWKWLCENAKIIYRNYYNK